MTKFKVGDRVRHAKFGAGTVVESLCDDEPKGMVCVHFETWDEYDGDDDYHAIRDIALWRDPPLDTRRRLREYTADLEVDDELSVAGVWFRVTGKGWVNPTGDADAVAHRVQMDGPTLRNLLVDEVRRKPRTKKRRVYEEVDDGSHKTGDLIVTEKGHHTAHIDVPRANDETVYRLVEETEVPR